MWGMGEEGRRGVDGMKVMADLAKQKHIIFMHFPVAHNWRGQGGSERTEQGTGHIMADRAGRTRLRVSLLSLQY